MNSGGGGGGGSNNDIKVMLREHDHTVECISWAPNTAYKSISEAFEEVIIMNVAEIIFLNIDLINFP